MCDSYEDSGVEEVREELYSEPSVPESVPELDFVDMSLLSSEDSHSSWLRSPMMDLQEENRMLLGPDLCETMLSLPFYPFDFEDTLLGGTQYTVYPDMDRDSYPVDANLSSGQDQQSTDESTDYSSVENESSESQFVSTNTSRKSRRAKHSWTGAEDALLRSLVEELGSDWKKISKRMDSDLTPKQCREHYNRMTKFINKNTWSEEEKAVLRLFLNGEIEEDELYLRLKRSKKQIKERLEIEKKNHSPWSMEELKCLESLVGTYGKEYAKIRTLMKSFGYDRSYQQVRCKVIAFLKKRL